MREVWGLTQWDPVMPPPVCLPGMSSSAYPPVGCKPLPIFHLPRHIYGVYVAKSCLVLHAPETHGFPVPQVTETVAGNTILLERHAVAENLYSFRTSRVVFCFLSFCSPCGATGIRLTPSPLPHRCFLLKSHIRMGASFPVDDIV